MDRVQKLAAQMLAPAPCAATQQQQEKSSIIQDGMQFAAKSAGEASLKDKVSAEEWALRCQLAAAYRIVAMFKWDDSINNHLTARVPGTEHFLINCMGDGFEEVTASSLVKIDCDGNVILEGSRGGAVNRAGFVIHSAMHAGLEHAHCVAHTHEANATAVACDPEGLLPITQTALLCGEISYHEFEGVAVSTDERARLVADMKPHSSMMILRNHGVLTVGESVASCITRLYFIHKACEIQVRLRAAAGGAALKPHPVKPEVQELVLTQQSVGAASGPELEMYSAANFALFCRRLDRVYPGYDV